MSGTFRSLALVALLPIVLAVAGVLVLQDQLKNRLLADMQTRLNAEIQGFEALYDQRRIVALRQSIEFRSQRGDPAGSIYALRDRNGAVLAGNLEDWPTSVAPPLVGQRVNLLGRPFLGTVLELRGGFDVLVGVDLSPLQQTQRQMNWIFAVFGGVMVLAGLGASAWVARTARQHTTRMNTALAAVGGAGGLGIRLARDAPEGSEHAELAHHIDAMLARIEHLFAAHQRLGNAVAHEMRTPLSRIRMRLDALDLEPDARASIDDEIRATLRLFDSLLSIAQMDAEAGNTSALKPVDLAAIASKVTELYIPLAEEEGRSITTSFDTGATVLGDADLLSQLMSNLIENGIKYTRPGDRISVSVRRVSSHVVLRVEDNGPGVDDMLRAQLFTPFARGKNVGDKPGHGLGLSLVHAIALRHGAEARLPEVAKGFAIVIEALHFPVKDAAD